MTLRLPLPFEEFVQEPQDPHAARRIAALNAPVIKKNEKQIISALTSLLAQLPGHGPESEKTKTLAREQFEKTQHLFLRHPLFAAHPWLVPYAIAARMPCHVIACGAMHYNKRYHTEALPHLTKEEEKKCQELGLKFSKRKHGPKNNEKSLLNPRKQRLSYQDIEGVSQTAFVPSLLMMGYQTGASFNRATQMGMESLFVISHKALRALAEVTISGIEKPKATPLDHLVPARQLIEQENAASRPSSDNRRAIGHATYRQGQLDGFFKPPRP